MKPTVDEKMNEILDIAAVESPQELVIVQPAEIVSSGNPEKDMDYDFDVARRTLHNLVDKGNELVDNANFFAKEKQDSRSVEAAAMAQKEARDTALALINLRKTRKEIDKIGITSVSGDMNVTQNAVFIGSTSELQKQMKELNASGAFKDALRTIDVSVNSDEEEKK